jgi:hypothetical protein
MIIKNFEKKVFLLNPVKNMPEEINNHIVNALKALKNRSSKNLKTYEVIKVQVTLRSKKIRKTWISNLIMKIMVILNFYLIIN